MSLARAWISAALNANLTQNELKAFLVIFQQTLGYGKASDALTFKRIASLARVRIDRLTPALRALACPISRPFIHARASAKQTFSTAKAQSTTRKSGTYR